MKLLLSRMLLGVAGLLLLVIGAAVLFNPLAFAASNGVEMPNLPSALSEYRAPGGVLLLSAVLILVSAARAHLIRAGLALAALVYGSYGAARLVGLLLDGMPSAALTQAMIIELLIGSMCFAAFLSLDKGHTNAGLATSA